MYYSKIYTAITIAINIYYIIYMYITAPLRVCLNKSGISLFVCMFFTPVVVDTVSVGQLGATPWIHATAPAVPP